jgi:exodeoxyribonuclease V gamma subunit
VYSTLAPKHRLASWVRFLALSAAWLDLTAGAVTVGRGRKERLSRPQVRCSSLRPLAASAAQGQPVAVAVLTDLVELYDRGMCEPLPLLCATSAAWAEARRAGGDAREAARRAWTSERGIDREDREAEHVLVFGGVQAFESILAVPPSAAETGPAWPGGESTRFGRLARRLWDRLLDQERLQ